eukprot:4604979-Pleurochrysis_carterae.AAC.5
MRQLFQCFFGEPRPALPFAHDARLWHAVRSSFLRLSSCSHRLLEAKHDCVSIEDDLELAPAGRARPRAARTPSAAAPRAQREEAPPAEKQPQASRPCRESAPQRRAAALRSSLRRGVLYNTRSCIALHEAAL